MFSEEKIDPIKDWKKLWRGSRSTRIVAILILLYHITFWVLIVYLFLSD